jgi:excisionase family DNA binding protein
MSINVTSDEARTAMKPLAVSVKTACKLTNIGNTKMWTLIKAGRIRTVSVGRRRLVIYSSLEEFLAA